MGNFDRVEDDVEPSVSSLEKLSTHLLELNHHDNEHYDGKEQIKACDCISKLKSTLYAHKIVENASFCRGNLLTNLCHNNDEHKNGKLYHEQREQNQ